MYYNNSNNNNQNVNINKCQIITLINKTALNQYKRLQNPTKPQNGKARIG